MPDSNAPCEGGSGDLLNGGFQRARSRPVTVGGWPEFGATDVHLLPPSPIPGDRTDVSVARGGHHLRALRDGFVVLDALRRLTGATASRGRGASRTTFPYGAWKRA